MVLIYPGLLPAGALVRVTDTALRPDPSPATHSLSDVSPDLSPPAPLWLDSTKGVALSEAGRVTGWASRGTMAGQAHAVAGNAKGTAYEDRHLHFVAAENGGLRLSDVVTDAATLSFGLIVTPDLPDARTLVSIQPLGHGEALDDYVFLSLEGLVLRLVRRGSDSALTLTLPPQSTVPLLIICALSGGEGRLSVNGQAAVTGKLPAQGGAADLFIGCRNGRGGMKNKLGGFDLSDVMIWPGQDVLREATGATASLAMALWNHRCRFGL